VKQLQKKCDRLGYKLIEAQNDRTQLQKKCNALSSKQLHGYKLKWGDLGDSSSDYCHPSELRMNMFQTYVEKIKKLAPFLTVLINLFVSTSAKRKAQATDTNPKWKIWAFFFQAWLLDMFCRSRMPKQVRRTTLLVSAYMLLCNISDPAWRFLQRLRIVISKEAVEKWIQAHKKKVRSETSVLFYVFDNCNFWLNVTKVRSDHRTSYLNIINHFIVELPVSLKIKAKRLWQNVDRKLFGEWLSSSNDDSLGWTQYVWKKFRGKPHNKPLKHVYAKTKNRLYKSDYTILPPVVDRETLSYKDIKAVVKDFAAKYIISGLRNFAFVVGDQQVWIKLYKLRLSKAKKYNWLIPIPGGWHWTWHILKGIFLVYYSFVLLPFSKMLGYKSLDESVANFHYSEDFLEIVTIAIFMWIQKAVENAPGNPTITEWLHSIKKNRVAYELAYACIHYFISYWLTR
jgi:hypothetical protein